MSQIIKWVRDFEADVGSILVYRSSTGRSGTYSILATVGAKDGSGDWIGSYVDAGGSADFWYKIQTWNGVGSSEFSDPISGEYWYLLAEIDDVKDELRLTSLNDISDSEVYMAINDADDWIYTQYGDPIKKTYTYFYSGSYTYRFNDDRSPVYKIDRVEFENGNGVSELIETGSYTINLKDSEITFISSVVENNSGRRIDFEFIPRGYHLLCKFKAALDIAEANLITDGDKAAAATVRRLEKKFNQMVDALKPSGAYASSAVTEEGDTMGPGRYIEQDWPV